MKASIQIGICATVNLIVAVYLIITWMDHSDTFGAVIGVITFCILTWMAWDVRDSKTDRYTRIRQENIELKRLLSDTWKMIDLARLEFGERNSDEYRAGWEMYRKLDAETIEYRGL
jgi:hypothetical protein